MASSTENLNCWEYIEYCKPNCKPIPLLMYYYFIQNSLTSTGERQRARESEKGAPNWGARAGINFEGLLGWCPLLSLPVPVLLSLSVQPPPSAVSLAMEPRHHFCYRICYFPSASARVRCLLSKVIPKSEEKVIELWISQSLGSERERSMMPVRAV